IAGGLAAEMVIVSYTVATKGAARLSEHPMAAGVTGLSNAEAIGRVLYTQYIYFFQAAGMVLLVAMIGAIVLTLRHKPGVRRQVIADQVARTPRTGMRVVSLKPGQGTSEPSFAEASEGPIPRAKGGRVLRSSKGSVGG